MICVKTRMKDKPKACTLCSLYANRTRFGESCCMANGYMRSFGDFKPSKGRPEWCPLREVSPCLGERN